MQEAAGGGMDAYFLALLVDVEAVEGLHRAVGLAMDGAKGREVMPPDQMRGAFMHGGKGEPRADPPGPMRIQGQWRPAIGDPVEVAPANAGEARMPVVSDRLGGKYCHRIGSQQGVQALAQSVRREVLLNV